MQLKEEMWKTLDFNLMVSIPWDFAVFYANNIELDKQLQDLYFDILFRSDQSRTVWYHRISAPLLSPHLTIWLWPV